MKKKRILVVDDEPGMLLLAKIALDDPCWEITTACDGNDCLNKLEKGKRPDLIILDIMMPKISGLEVCSAIRSQARFRDTKIIYHTALPGQDMDINLENTMADDYIMKGLSQEDFRQKVDEVLNG